MNAFYKDYGLLVLFSCFITSCASEFGGGKSVLENDLQPKDFRPKNYSVGSGSPQMLSSLALIHHPQMAALRYRVKRLEARVAQERALPDPQATLALGSLPETASGRVEAMAGISQKIPFPGKRDAAAKAAAHEAAAVKAEMDALALQISEQVKSAWWDYYMADQTVSYTVENRQLLQTVVEVVEAKFSSSQASQADQLNIGNELNKLDRDLAEIYQVQNSAKARINSLLNRPEGAKLPAPRRSPLPSQSNLRSLIAKAEKTHPNVVAAQQRIAAFDQKLRRAKLEKYPDVSVGIQGASISSDGLARSSNGRDQLFGTLGFNLPLWQEPRKAMVREASAGIAETKALLESERASLRYRVSDAYFRAKTAREVIQLFEKKIIPSAEQSFDLTLSAYSAGTATFTEVIEAQRDLLTYQLQLISNRSQLGKAIATLEAAAGLK